MLVLGQSLRCYPTGLPVFSLESAGAAGEGGSVWKTVGNLIHYVCSRQWVVMRGVTRCRPGSPKLPPVQTRPDSRSQTQWEQPRLASAAATWQAAYPALTLPLSNCFFTGGCSANSVSYKVWHQFRSVGILSPHFYSRERIPKGLKLKAAAAATDASL